MIPLFFKWILWTLLLQFCTADFEETPHIHPISNITIPVGHEAVFPCTVDNLRPYKVAWVQEASRTILTIHTHVITRSKRIGFSIQFEGGSWNLHIRNVKKSDSGYYVCEVNTDPMMRQRAYLEVVDIKKPDDIIVPILDETNDAEERPDEDSSAGCCLPTYTAIIICFIFVVATAIAV